MEGCFFCLSLHEELSPLEEYLCPAENPVLRRFCCSRRWPSTGTEAVKSALKDYFLPISMLQRMIFLHKSTQVTQEDWCPLPLPTRPEVTAHLPAPVSDTKESFAQPPAQSPVVLGIIQLPPRVLQCKQTEVSGGLSIVWIWVAFSTEKAHASPQISHPQVFLSSPS